jgi:hypothetical protein
MSQSKAPDKRKPANTKARSKTKSVAKSAAVETVRIIPAPESAAMPKVNLTPAEDTLSTDAKALASKIETALHGNERAVVLDPEAVQALITALCKVYSQHTENGSRYDAFSTRNPVTPTDVMVTASGLLKAANLAVFELGMWQSWTGR